MEVIVCKFYLIQKSSRSHTQKKQESIRKRRQDARTVVVLWQCANMGITNGISSFLILMEASISGDTYV